MNGERILPMHIALPEMDVLLSERFLENILSKLPTLHSHPCYELICVEDASGSRFTVVPPRTAHIAIDLPPENRARATSMLFTFLPESGAQTDVCSVLRAIAAPTEVEDAFDGAARIRAVRRALDDGRPGIREKLAAELRLLFVDLSRALLSTDRDTRPPVQTLDEERIYLLESFFNGRYQDPLCSKKQLADAIGVSERQLSRILTENYSSTFRAILTRTRMSFAEAMRRKGGRSAAEIAAAVGYTSLAAFRRTYAEQFGYPFRTKTTERDMPGEKQSPT